LVALGLFAVFQFSTFAGFAAEPPGSSSNLATLAAPAGVPVDRRPTALVVEDNPADVYARVRERPDVPKAELEEFRKLLRVP